MAAATPMAPSAVSGLARSSTSLTSAGRPGWPAIASNRSICFST